ARWTIDALELGDLIEAELHGSLALEEGDEHGELAALGLDLADRTGQACERALLDRDGLADLEVDLLSNRSSDRATALGSARLRGSLDGSDERLEHRECFLEAQRRRVVGVTDKAGYTRCVAHDRPAVLVEFHTNKHIAGDAHAVDELALPVLDLDDILHRNLNLVDE